MRERERERLHFLVSVDASRQCMESRFVSLHFPVEMRLVQPAAVHIPSVDLSPATWIQQPLWILSSLSPSLRCLLVSCCLTWEDQALSSHHQPMQYFITVPFCCWMSLWRPQVTAVTVYPPVWTTPLAQWVSSQRERTTRYLLMFTEVSRFTISMCFTSCFRCFLGPGDLLPCFLCFSPCYILASGQWLLERFFLCSLPLHPLLISSTVRILHLH